MPEFNAIEAIGLLAGFWHTCWVPQIYKIWIQKEPMVLACQHFLL